MTTLFLSYAGADRAIATALKEGLIRAGFDHPLWQDIDQIRGGDNWLITLEEALRDCSGYVIVVGPGGIHRWVRFELYAAIRRYFESNGQFPVFPVLLPGASPQSLPSFLSIIQAEKLPDHPEPEDYQRLAAVLARLLAKHGAEAAPTEAVMFDRSPWPGLVSYDRSLERFFFGRPTEILEALKRLGSVHGGLYRRWLQVEGPSGGGKSSLVLAGVLPAIERGWLGDGGSTQSGAWLIAIMRPGSSPIDNLATELAKVLPGWRGRAGELKTSFLKPGNDEALKFLVREECPERLLLVIDQFEEIFGPNVPPEQRTCFDRLLDAALADRDGPLHLLTTIRSDFTLKQQEELPALSPRLNDLADRYYLPPITRHGLRDAILRPARLAGLVWGENTLPARIEDEAANTPNPLPLVSNLLAILWDRKQGNRLLGEVEQELGGVGGALSNSADTLWDNLTEDQQTRARLLLLKMVSVGSNRPDTRRTIPLSTALRAAGGGEQAREVLNRLSGQGGADRHQLSGLRLVVVRPRGDAGIAENHAEKGPREEDLVADLSHEALLSRWKRMREWLADPVTRLQLEAEDALEDAARFWEKDGKPDFPGLPDPRMLTRYFNANAPTPLAEDYLAALRREQARETENRRRDEEKRKRRTMGVALTATLGGILLLSGMLWGFDHWAKQNNKDADLGTGFMALQTRFVLLFRKPPEPEMVSIKGGTFEMGSPDGEGEKEEHPQHSVTVKGFQMGKYEVTFEQYDEFARATLRTLPQDQGWGRGRRPVINVSWEDAKAYAQWLSVKTVKPYRLPSEAEWEYAARANSTTAFFWGSDESGAKDYAWFSENSEDKTHPVGEKKPNGSLYDMAGNVWEWTADCWHESYKNAPSDGDAWKASDGGECARRVVRGGSWSYDPPYLRTADRLRNSSDAAIDSLGFRLAQDK